jgi:hypothetical protein
LVDAKFSPVKPSKLLPLIGVLPEKVVPDATGASNVNQLLVEINPPALTWSVCADKLCLPVGSIDNWHWTVVADDQDVDAQFVDEGRMAKPVVGVPSVLPKFRPEIVTTEPPLEAMFGGAVNVTDGCGTSAVSEWTRGATLATGTAGAPFVNRSSLAV